ncbi:glutaredoxin family protein [Desulfomonile tiedjei]|nr:glutaredoxin family protein [Desulfomonile tiedjei]
MAKRVKMYGISTCTHSRCAKEFLSFLGVEFECTDLDLISKEMAGLLMEEVKRLNGRCSFPTILIGDKVVVGCRKELIQEALEND